MKPEFFEYFPSSAQARKWGVHATAFGHGTAAPRAAYPLPSHPRDHRFSWERGRTLGEYQLIHISRGRGRLETRKGGSVPVRAGDTFLLFPGVWHRYRPDPATGWTESWIELQGGEMDRLRREKVIDPAHPLVRAGEQEAPEIAALFGEAAHLARLKPPGFTIRLGLLALQIVAVLEWGSPRRALSSRTVGQVSRSQSLLAPQSGPAPAPEAVARRLGIGYSHFRRMFKRQIGLSPKQFQVEIRQQQARHLLRNTGLAVKEIAERLGYHSPYHFSLDFKRRVGSAPALWRQGRGV